MLSVKGVLFAVFWVIYWASETRSTPELVLKLKHCEDDTHLNVANYTDLLTMLTKKLKEQLHVNPRKIFTADEKNYIERALMIYPNKNGYSQVDVNLHVFLTDFLEFLHVYPKTEQSFFAFDKFCLIMEEVLDRLVTAKSYMSDETERKMINILFAYMKISEKHDHHTGTIFQKTLTTLRRRLISGTYFSERQLSKLLNFNGNDYNEKYLAFARADKDFIGLFLVEIESDVKRNPDIKSSAILRTIHRLIALFFEKMKGGLQADEFKEGYYLAHHRLMTFWTGLVYDASTERGENFKGKLEYIKKLLAEVEGFDDNLRSMYNYPPAQTPNDIQLYHQN